MATQIATHDEVKKELLAQAGLFSKAIRAGLFYAGLVHAETLHCLIREEIDRRNKKRKQ